MKGQSLEARVAHLEKHLTHILSNGYKRLMQRVNVIEAKIDSTIEALQLDVARDVVPKQPLASSTGPGAQDEEGWEEEAAGESDDSGGSQAPVSTQASPAVGPRPAHGQNLCLRGASAPVAFSRRPTQCHLVPVLAK